MKAKDLISVWTAPDNSRLTPKQFSFRLPLDVAARLHALCEAYPSRSRTEVVGDLLRLALLEVEKTLPYYKGEQEDIDHLDGSPIYRGHGVKAAYRIQANEEYQRLERELGNDKPGLLFEGEFWVGGDSE